MTRRILIVIGYTIATIVILLGTVLLAAYGSGYSYDFKSGRLVHRGLIIVDSSPSGAQVLLDSKALKQKTSYRGTYEKGIYNFTVMKDGYRTWQKAVEAIPAQATLVQYIILMPQHFKVEPVFNYPAVNQSLASRDRRRIAYVVPSGGDTGIWSLDTQGRSRTKVYAPAPATEGQPSETFQAEGWADDASRLLVKRTIGDQVAYLVVAANGNDQPINLTENLKITQGSLQFNPTNSREMYWLGPEGLRRVSLTDQSLSAVVADKAAAYAFAGDRVVYVDTTQSEPRLMSIDRSGRKQKLAGKLPLSATYSLAYRTYIGTPQVVLTAPDSKTAALYTNPFNKPTLKTISSTANRAAFNDDGRFILLADEHHVSTYDLERSKLYTFPEINSTVTGLSWFDNYHVQFNRGGQSVIAEFDGNYAIAITRGDGLAPFGSADGKFLYVTGQTSTGNTQVKAIRIKE